MYRTNGLPALPPAALSVLSRRRAIGAATLAIGGLAVAIRAPAQAGDGVARTEESIHQERWFKAERRRVYEALTQAALFDRVAQRSEAMQSAAMAQRQQPSFIDPNLGGALRLFGGYITGRQLELVPPELIVQAWRVGNWERGRYSIARFELVEQDAGTKIVFDHVGFPNGQAEHLAQGWQGNYWAPLAKVLAE
jgi:uncharacterized protein YndB with AHSA1/START domain